MATTNTATETEKTPDPKQSDTGAAGTAMGLAERTARAQNKVKNHMLASVAIGAVPLPLVDLAGITAIQLKMLHGLARLYGVEFSKQLGKSAIGSLLGGVAPVAAAPVGISLAKLLPVAGQTVAFATMPVLAGATTYAVGKVFIQHFESGGTFLTFDPERVREYFAEQFKKGKKLSSSAKEEGREAASV